MAVKNENINYKWAALLASFLLTIGYSLSLQVLPPLFSQIASEITLTSTQEGILMGAHAFPGILLPFVIAYVTRRFDLKAIIITGLLTMISGSVFFSLAGSFWTLLVARLLSGVGATVLIVIAPLLVTLFFERGEMGVGMGVFNMGVPLGTVIAGNLFNYLAGFAPWRSIIRLVAGYLIFLLVFLLFVLPSFSQRGEETGPGDPKNTGSFRGSAGLWLLVGIWALSNFQLLAYITFGARYYQAGGIAVGQAGFLTSLVMLVQIILSPFLGILFDKSSRKNRLLLLGNILISVLYLLMARGFPFYWVYALGMGLGFAPIPIFVYSYLPRTVRQDDVSMALGFLTVASNLGTTLGPIVFGRILDHVGGAYPGPFMALGLVAVLVTIASWAMRRSR